MRSPMNTAAAYTSSVPRMALELSLSRPENSLFVSFVYFVVVHL